MGSIRKRLHNDCVIVTDVKMKTKIPSKIKKRRDDDLMSMNVVCHFLLFLVCHGQEERGSEGWDAQHFTLVLLFAANSVLFFLALAPALSRSFVELWPDDEARRWDGNAMAWSFSVASNEDGPWTAVCVSDGVGVLGRCNPLERPKPLRGLPCDRPVD